MQKLLLKLIDNKFFTKYYNKYPKNIDDLYTMANRVKTYLKDYDKTLEKF